MAYVAIIIAVIAADQLSKTAVTSAFQLYESLEVVPGFFNLVFVTNSGAAFSMLADVDSPWRHYFFLGVGVIAVLGLTIACVRMRSENPLYSVPLGLIAGGAIGNLIDRVRLGAVVDFLDFHLAGWHWPAFNVADSAICVGAVSFLLLNFVDGKKQNIREKK